MMDQSIDKAPDRMRHGSQLDPPNRFETTRREYDFEHIEWDEEYIDALKNRRIEYIYDKSQSIISKNNSPDLPFNHSLNPYRGCVHGCSYCYARPGHEYLGFNAGLDFETKIVVKPDAPRLLREFLSRKSWRPEPISFSGVTDCYQPAEREFQLTRECLEVALEFRQPLSIVTKNALVIRDLDLLEPLAALGLVHVYLSVTTLDPNLARLMEPRTSIPAARLRAVEMLSAKNIPVGVMTAPIIPGLNDSEIPELLEAASKAGAMCAGYTLLRLPLSVEPVFREWLERTHHDHEEKVLGRIRQSRGGKLNDSTWGQRMRGDGEIADQVRKLFRVFAKRFGLEANLPSHNCDSFRRSTQDGRQLTLF